MIGAATVVIETPPITKETYLSPMIALWEGDRPDRRFPEPAKGSRRDRGSRRGA
jgi:hypothetical protein